MKTIIALVQKGLVALRLNTQYLLVVVLLVVFPLLFVGITESIFDVARQNSATVEKQQLHLIHHILTQDWNVDVSPETSRLFETIPTLTSVAIFEYRDDEYVLMNKQGTGDVAASPQLPLFAALSGVDGGVYIHEYYRADGVRMWHAYQRFTKDDTVFLIVTEHSFRTTDTLLAAREQQVYLGLSSIFIFLIALTYWLVRQKNWAIAYQTIAAQRDDQVMFTNSVAHELRAPLTVIKGYASLLRESPTLNATEQSHTDKIAVSTERLILLINDFLEVARLQAGRVSVKKESVLLTSLLSDVLHNFEPQASKKNIALTLQGPSDVTLVTDAARLTQIMTNLISNAIKYTDAGSIVVTVDQTRLVTQIKVQDTGQGISAEDQQKLFQPFSRVGNAEAKGVLGTGLGMWITKQLVTLLGGSIVIESIEGVGTAVKVSFRA